MKRGMFRKHLILLRNFAADERNEKNMNILKLNEIRYKILSDVKKEFTDELIPAKLTDPGENDVPVLNVILSGSDEDTGNMTGEFFFMESAANDEIQYFVNLITVYEDVPEENLPELAVAVSALNTYVPVGAFAIDYAAQSLIYKLTYLMPANADEMSIREAVDNTMGCTFQALTDFSYLLSDVCEGDRSAESVIEVVSGEL